jgi:hypothetical protein
VQVRAGAPPGVREPLGPDGADLYLVVRLVAHGGLEGQGIGAQRVEPESERAGGAQRQPQIFQVLTLQLREAPDRRRAHLHQALDELRRDARPAAFSLGSLPAAFQELVGAIREQPGLFDQEELLLEPDAAVRWVPSCVLQTKLASLLKNGLSARARRPQRG